MTDMERLQLLRKKKRLAELRAKAAQQAQQIAQPTEQVQTTQAQQGAPEQSFGQQFIEGLKQTPANILGSTENIASLVSGAISEPIAGYAGLIQSANPWADEGAGARAVEGVRDTLTYQPQTKVGQRQQQGIAEALAPIGEGLSAAENFLGEETLEATGSPALAAIAHTLPTAALEILGVKGARKATAVTGASDRLIKKTLLEATPEVDKIKGASRAIFNELDSSGVAVNQKALRRLQNNLTMIAKKEGIDVRVTPEAAGAIDAINEAIASGKSLPTSEMDTLRTIAKNSIVATDANKMRVGSAVVDEIDDFLDNIKSADIDKGAQISAGDVGKKYRAARKLWGRAKRSEMLTDAIEMGSSRKAGVEKGIRNELNNLLNRKKSRKFLSEEDVAAIRKVTDGDFKQNFASLIGGMGLKFENSPSMFSSIIGGGGVGAVASQVPGLTGAIAPIAVGAITVGTIAKEVAKRLTKNSARFLDTMNRAGTDGRRITKAYLDAVPKSKRRVSDLSDLLLDADIDLTALENIASETVKDAVKSAKFKRELLQASAALTAGAKAPTLEDERE